MTPKVSVVMPSFNHERFVRTAIESVLTSTFADLEVLVTDDGSSDDSAKIIRSIEDPRLRFEAFEVNRGACLAMNSAIRRARGKYIAVLNSDDVSLPHRILRQVEFLDEHPDVGAVFGQPLFIDAEGRPLVEDDTFYGSRFIVPNRTRGEWIRHFFLEGNCLCHPSVMIRRHCYEVAGLYNPAFAQLPDFDMWIRVVQHFSIHILDEPLVQFRILEGGRNASAPRLDVALRIEFEWLTILESFLHVDVSLLLDAFPEIEGPRVPAGKPGLLARGARKILERLSEGGAQAATQASRPLAWRIAELALGVPRRANALFALRTMYSLLPEIDDPLAYAAFIKLAGSVDPFGLVSRR